LRFALRSSGRFNGLRQSKPARTGARSRRDPPPAAVFRLHRAHRKNISRLMTQINNDFRDLR